MLIEDGLKKIYSKDIKDMTVSILESYKSQMKDMPSSLSGNWHEKGETAEIHIEKTLDMLFVVMEEFSLKSVEIDILISAAILHDIANCIFISKDRDSNQAQKLYPTGFNRSPEAYRYHPILGSFVVGKYIIDNKLIVPELFVVSQLIASHMGKWLEDYNYPAVTRLQDILCMADYLASRKGFKT